MRTLLRIGVALAFALVVVGAPFVGLAVVGILALLERLEARP